MAGSVVEIQPQLWLAHCAAFPRTQEMVPRGRRIDFGRNWDGLSVLTHRRTRVLMRWGDMWRGGNRLTLLCICAPGCSCHPTSGRGRRAVQMRETFPHETAFLETDCRCVIPLVHEVR